MYEMEEEEENLENPSQEPKEVKLYSDVHHKRGDGNWIHPQAEANYEQMIELWKQPIEEDGENLTGAQIISGVVKPKSGKAGRLENKVRRRSRDCCNSEVRAREILNQKLESQQAIIDELLSSHKYMKAAIKSSRKEKDKPYEERKNWIVKKLLHQLCVGVLQLLYHFQLLQYHLAVQF